VQGVGLMLDEELVHDRSGVFELLIDHLWRSDVVLPLSLYVLCHLDEVNLIRGGVHHHLARDGGLFWLRDRLSRVRNDLVQVRRRCGRLGVRFDARLWMTRWGGIRSRCASFAHGALGAELVGSREPNAPVWLPCSCPRGAVVESHELAESREK
jgi:hypothetical protein